jgi:hypothetical protein
MVFWNAELSLDPLVEYILPEVNAGVPVCAEPQCAYCRARFGHCHYFRTPVLVWRTTSVSFIFRFISGTAHYVMSDQFKGHIPAA